MAPSKRIVRTIRNASCDEITARRVTGVPCDFCGHDEDDELTFGNLYRIGDIAAHYFCVILSSGSEQHGNDDDGLLGFLYKDIKKELVRSKKNRCTYCRRKGATLGCAEKTCKKQYHLPCARSHHAICLFYGKFEVFCPHHAEKQVIPVKVILARLNKFAALTRDNVTLPEKQCQICFQEVGPSPSFDTFWPPCCGAEKDEWFHRSCLERFALHAGLYHLKCPLCNNKEQFNAAVERFGYYIPDRDASWEGEGNTYEDPALECKAEGCPDVSRDDDSGDWNLMVCVACGGNEVHAGCAVTLPHRCLICLDPTSGMELEPLPTVQDIERGVVPRMMPSRMSLRRTMPRKVLENSKLFLFRNKRSSTMRVSSEYLDLKPKLEREESEASPTKVIRDELYTKTHLLGLKNLDIDYVVSNIRQHVCKPGPRSKKETSIRNMIEDFFEKLLANTQQPVCDSAEAGPSGGVPTVNEPETANQVFTTPIKKANISNSSSSCRRSEPSPQEKMLNLETKLAHIRTLAINKAVSNLVERLNCDEDVTSGSVGSDTTASGETLVDGGRDGEIHDEAKGDDVGICNGDIDDSGDISNADKDSNADVDGDIEIRNSDKDADVEICNADVDDNGDISNADKDANVEICNADVDDNGDISNADKNSNADADGDIEIRNFDKDADVEICNADKDSNAKMIGDGEICSGNIDENGDIHGNSHINGIYSNDENLNTDRAPSSQVSHGILNDSNEDVINTPVVECEPTQVLKSPATSVEERVSGDYGNTMPPGNMKENILLRYFSDKDKSDTDTPKIDRKDSASNIVFGNTEDTTNESLTEPAIPKHDYNKNTTKTRRHIALEDTENVDADVTNDRGKRKRKILHEQENQNGDIRGAESTKISQLRIKLPKYVSEIVTQDTQTADEDTEADKQTDTGDRDCMFVSTSDDVQITMRKRPRGRMNKDSGLSKTKKKNKLTSQMTVRDKQFELKIMFKNTKMLFEIGKSKKRAFESRDDIKRAEVRRTDDKLRQTSMHKYFSVAPR